MGASLPTTRDGWLSLYRADLAQLKFDLCINRGMGIGGKTLVAHIITVQGKIASLEEYSVIGTNYYPQGR